MRLRSIIARAKGPYTTFCGLAAEILENQVTLDTIVKNQKKILAKP
jgi:hypothetical protein